MWRAAQVAELKQIIEEAKAENARLQRAVEILAKRAYVAGIKQEGRSITIEFERNGQRAALTAYPPMGFKVTEWHRWFTST